MKVTLKLELELPSVPKFIWVKGQSNTIPIADIDEEVLREIGKQWTDALIKLAKSKEQKT